MDDETDEVKQKQTSMMDDLRDMYEQAIENPGLMSLSDITESDDTEDALEELSMLHSIVHMILYNIKDNSPEKISAARKLVQEYSDMAITILDDYESGKEDTEESKEKRKPVMDKLKSLFSVFKEKKYKTEGGVKFPASDFLFVPDPQKPSTWKLRIAEGKPGNVTIAQLGRAAAAFSSGGFRGNKVQLPGGKGGSVKAKLRSLYKRLGAKDDEIPESIRKESPIMIFKDINDNLRWFARYSNNYRDDDHPAEIISEKSHKKFIDMVDSGDAPMPELWHWHVPGTAWGKADWVAYDDENGIAMASGYVLPGHEKEAEAIVDLDIGIGLGVSHGMPAKSVMRDPSDGSIIVGHITREISDLPLWAAANKLTSISVLKETDQMAIPEQKKEYLRELISEEMIQEIEEGNEALAKLAKENGIESKEQSESPVHEEPVAETQPEIKEGAIPQNVQEPIMVTKEEVASAIVETLKPLIDQIKSLSDRIDVLAKEQEDAKKESGSPVVPTASLAAMIAQQMRAIGSQDAVVRKDSKLATSGPDETPVPDEQTMTSTGNPVIDGVISSIIGGRK